MNRVPLEQLSLGSFAPLLNSKFLISTTGMTVPIELKLVEATACPGADARSESFSLIFTGPLGRFAAQQTYLFQHAELGSFELFIVPIGRDAAGFRYQAVFNRVTDSAKQPPLKKKQP